MTKEDPTEERRAAKEALLKRLSDIEDARIKHEADAERLLMERDQLIYDALNATPKTARATEIADALQVDRSWPYRVRDEFLERQRRYHLRHPS